MVNGLMFRPKTESSIEGKINLQKKKVDLSSDDCMYTFCFFFWEITTTSRVNEFKTNLYEAKVRTTTILLTSDQFLCFYNNENKAY